MEDDRYSRPISTADPLVRRYIRKRDPAYRKRKQRLLKYPETRGVKPPFPGYDPDYFKNREAREWEQFKRKPVHVKKYWQVNQDRLAESSTKYGPYLPAVPTYAWDDEKGWMHFDDEKGPKNARLVFAPGTEDYWRMKFRARRERARTMLRQRKQSIYARTRAYMQRARFTRARAYIRRARNLRNQ